MKYLLDTANVDFIKKACDLYPVAGVTTNPSIITKEKRSFKEIIKEIRDVLGPGRMLHVQTLSLDAESIVKEAQYIHELVGGEVYIKIPVISQGFKAIKILKSLGIKTTATGVITPQQGLMAAVAGADCVIPYVNRIDSISGDGVGVVSDIIQLFEINDIDAMLIAASFKTVSQINNVCLAGAPAVTVSADLFQKLIEHPLTDQSVVSFAKDWESQYGEGATTIGV